MAPSHEQCRGRVCLLCFAKGKKENNTFRKVTPALWSKIELHVLQGLDREDTRLPSALCPTCVRSLNEFDQPPEKKRSRREIPLGDHSLLNQVTTHSAAAPDALCHCFVCRIAQSVPADLSSVRGAAKMPENPRRPTLPSKKDGETEFREETRIQLCTQCLSKIGRGLPHQCTKISRLRSIEDMATAECDGSTSREKIASAIRQNKGFQC